MKPRQNILFRHSAWALAAGILALNTLLHGYGLGDLEFFRHTEADRSLIAWEMLNKGDYLVPHLLGEAILTKPPLFYWLQAFSFFLQGDYSEFNSRVISLVASILFVFSHFVFLWFVTHSLRLSTLGALVLCTGGAFFVQATVGEIDMMFSFLTALALYGGFFLCIRPTIGTAVFAYFFLGLAFLTKGPPAPVFFALGQFSWWLVEVIFRKNKPPYRELFAAHAWGFLVFIFIACLWFVPLVLRLGGEELLATWDYEIVRRIVEDSRKQRSIFFYFGALLSAPGVWTPFFLSGVFVSLAGVWLRLFPRRVGKSANSKPQLLAAIFSRLHQGFETSCQEGEFRRLCIYAWSVLLPSLLILSLAEGKSSRYLFPLYSLLAILALMGWESMRSLEYSENFRRHLRVVLYFLMLAASLGAGAFGMNLFSFNLFSSIAFCLGLLGVVLILGGFLVCALTRQSNHLFLYLVILMFVARLGYVHIYIPHRNTLHSVKTTVQTINALVPEDVPIYSALMYERWISYYLVRSGRQLVQNSLSCFSDVSGDYSYFLLSEVDDKELKEGLSLMPSARVLYETISQGKSLLLYEVLSSELAGLSGRNCR